MVICLTFVINFTGNFPRYSDDMSCATTLYIALILCMYLFYRCELFQSNLKKVLDLADKSSGYSGLTTA